MRFEASLFLSGNKQVATIPAINSNPAEDTFFPNYCLGSSVPSRETGNTLVWVWKVDGTGATCRGTGRTLNLIR